MKTRLVVPRPRSLWTAVLLSMLVPVLAAAAAVIPAGSKPYGKSYGEWGAAWWNWAISIPYSSNPIFDPDGSSCGVGQSGPVWFLAGSPGGTVTRTCSVPAGKGIFFPIVDFLVDYPCPPEFGFEPAPGQSLEDFLTEYGAFILGYVDHMAVDVDGVAIGGLSTYRGTSRMFTFTGDPSLTSTYDPCITGTPQPGVSDGYWIMLAPLPSGEHTVHFSATLTGLGFGLDVTYALHVGPSTGGPITILSTSGDAPAGPLPGQPSLKSLAQSAHAVAGTRQGTWGNLKVIYR